MIQPNSTLTAVSGIRAGHATDRAGGTGCTVVLCPPGTVGGVDQRGGGPGTRETDLLRPTQHVDNVSAILLSGGSAYGLAAAEGVMRWLEERDVGYRTGDGAVVPIVPAAILYDLGIGVDILVRMKDWVIETAERPVQARSRRAGSVPAPAVV